MSAGVALLTPDEGQPGRWPELFDRYRSALAAEGLELRRKAWTTDEDLSGFDLVLPLLAWTYFADAETWQRRLDQWESSGARLCNPVSTLRWNTRKTYLQELDAKGLRIVPTAFVDTVTPQAIDAAFRDFGSDEIVLKPQVSGGGHQTIRTARHQPFSGGPAGPAMIQPFLSSVSTQGEASLFFFQEAYSHCVRKVARAGEFRVQPEHGGAIFAAKPMPDELALAEQAVGAAPGPLLYARVDLVRDSEGRTSIIELELIEPDLYLQYSPKGERIFARLVHQACEGR